MGKERRKPKREYDKLAAEAGGPLRSYRSSRCRLLPTEVRTHTDDRTRCVQSRDHARWSLGSLCRVRPPVQAGPLRIQASRWVGSLLRSPKKGDSYRDEASVRE